jgi:hydroxyethylthiazole kinase-like uncharacterized protein yjeF
MSHKKVFSIDTIRELDRLTLQETGISDWQLMEQAANAFVNVVKKRFPSGLFHVYCGPGNNGGDGLAIARLLKGLGNEVRVYVLELPGQSNSFCFLQNLELLPSAIPLQRAEAFEAAPNGMIIDAFLGSGVNRRAEGGLLKTIQSINQSAATVISVDIPSGIHGDGALPAEGAAIRADFTITFESAKAVFFLPEFNEYLGECITVPIGLSAGAMATLPAYAEMLSQQGIKDWLPQRHRWDHKGRFGHVLLVAGSIGKMGAATLAARAVMMAGAGKCTCYVPKAGLAAIQTTVPEAMAIPSSSKKEVDGLFDSSWADVIAIGPGIGQGSGAEKALKKVLLEKDKPMVIDADGLNLLGRQSTSFQARLPMVLTPHPGEADRLFGPSLTGAERLHKARDFASKKGAVIVLKGGKTAICCPEGNLYFCDLGNPGMATAGSGDVLTGVIAGLLAQGLTAEKAAAVGVFLHAQAGDLAASAKGQHSLIASDILEFMPNAFLKILS